MLLNLKVPQNLFKPNLTSVKDQAPSPHLTSVFKVVSYGKRLVGHLYVGHVPFKYQHLFDIFLSSQMCEILNCISEALSKLAQWYGGQIQIKKFWVQILAVLIEHLI